MRLSCLCEAGKIMSCIKFQPLRACHFNVLCGKAGSGHKVRWLPTKLIPF